MTLVGTPRRTDVVVVGGGVAGSGGHGSTSAPAVGRAPAVEGLPVGAVGEHVLQAGLDGVDQAGALEHGARDIGGVRPAGVDRADDLRAALRLLVDGVRVGPSERSMRPERSRVHRS